jgi:hypothetical protein
VVLEAGVGVERLTGEGVGLWIGAGVGKEFTEGVFSEPWGVRDDDHDDEAGCFLVRGGRELLGRTWILERRSRDRGLGTDRDEGEGAP